MNTLVAVVSGGMDSVTLAHLYRHQNPDDALVLLSVNYGQRHVRELMKAAKAAEDLHAEHLVVDLQGVGSLLTSALTTNTISVPEGHYAHESMRATVVPNRNAIMLNVAIGVAVARGAHLVGTGVHAGDHPIYPDCRPEFITSLTALARVANEGFIVPHFEVDAPFVHMGKHDIASLGDALGVDWRRTWSCYQGGDLHCGRCGTCRERIEAFSLAGLEDPTEYEPTRVG